MKAIEDVAVFGQRKDGTTERLWTLANHPAHLLIAGEHGADVVLDALVEYVADKPAMALRAIAALVNTLPTDSPHVHLGALNPAGQEFIAAQDAARTRKTIYGGQWPSTIESAAVTIDGVVFGAALSRPLTPEEEARLPEAVEVAPGCLVVL